MVVWSTDTPRSRSINSRSRAASIRDHGRRSETAGTRPQDHLRREVPTLEPTLPSCHSQYAPDVSNPALLPDQPAAANLATEPFFMPKGLKSLSSANLSSGLPA